MSDKIVNTVYQTTKYDRFHELLGNRDVLTIRVNKIKKSIEENGYIFNPIIVNEKAEVIDGQGRLRALRELQLPVDYIIVHGLRIKDCIALNISASNWTNMDYIQSYAQQGNHNYQNIEELIKAYRKIGIVSVISAVTGTCDNKSQKLKQGEIICSDEDMVNASELLSYANNFIDVILRNKKGSKDYMTYAIFFAYNHPEIDRQQLIKKFSKYYATEAVCPCFINIKSALKSLSAIYNFKSRSAKVYLDVDYEKYQEGRYGWYATRYGSLKQEAI